MYRDHHGVPKTKMIVEAQDAKRETSADFWRRVDGELVEAEAELVREKAWVSEATEASLTDLDEYLATLPLEAHEAALEGIKAYLEEVGQENGLLMGWQTFID